MKYGLWLWPIYRDGLPFAAYRELAVAAEELGYESVWMGHHIAVPAEMNTAYFGTEDGESPHDTFQQRHDPLIVLADIAHATTTLRLGTGIYLLPLTNLFTTARSVVSVDHMSNGRVLFGIGVGWCREEFDLMGVDFATRGRRTTDMAAALKKLWTDRVSEHDSEFVRFGPLGFEPKPIQVGGPPIIGSGLARAALERSATLDGVFLPAAEADVVRKSIKIIQDRREALGLADRPFEVTATCPMPPRLDTIGEFADAGVARVVLQPDGQPLGGPDVVSKTVPELREYLASLKSQLPSFEV